MFGVSEHETRVLGSGSFGSPTLDDGKTSEGSSCLSVVFSHGAERITYNNRFGLVTARSCVSLFVLRIEE